jgi:AraC-like DNA-binding protein
VVERDEPHFSSGYHAHPEFELVYIMEGFGKRIIGNKIDEFKKGDLVLIGPNVPHVWTSHETFKGDDAKRSKALVVYFNPKIFSDLFYEMEEARQLKTLFIQAEYGITITETIKKQIVLKLKRIAATKSFTRIVLLLDVLNRIAASGGFERINKQIVVSQPQVSDRLTQIVDYVNTNFKKDMSLKEAADIINLTPESFCRFFKQKTGKKFVDYLHETRVFYAMQSLITTDLTVAEIAYNNGFKTASNFNKRFKKINGHCPTEYRRAAASNIV